MFTEAEMRRMEREDAARLKELGGEGPRPVRVELLSHVLEPLGPLLDDGQCKDGAICFSVTVVPSGYHLTDGTRWHPTGDARPVEVDGETMTVPVGRQVPNLVTTEAGAANVKMKPSRVDAPPVAERGPHTREEVVSPNVTAAELAMARKEAAVMREADRGDHTTPEERRIWGGIASRRDRFDTSWLWGDGKERVVRSAAIRPRKA